MPLHEIGMIPQAVPVDQESRLLDHTPGRARRARRSLLAAEGQQLRSAHPQRASQQRKRTGIQPAKWELNERDQTSSSEVEDPTRTELRGARRPTRRVRLTLPRQAGRATRGRGQAEGGLIPSRRRSTLTECIRWPPRQ